MPHAKCRWSYVVVIAVCLLSFGFAQDKSRALRPASASSTPADDETALRALVDKFFAAYAKKDLDAIMALWSVKSPDYAARKQAMPQLFATEDYTFANLTISRVKVDGDKASLRAAVDLTAVNPQTKQERKERMIRSFAFVKEEGAWKVWRYAPAVDDLVAALVAAKTEEERKALLTAEKELVTAELRQALHHLGHGLERAGQYEAALKVWRDWLRLAEDAGDKRGAAEALNDIGTVHFRQGNYAEALEFFQKSLKMFEDLGNKAGIAHTLNSIGGVHFRQDNHVQALGFFQKSLKMFEDLGNKAGIAHTLNSIGAVYESQGNYAQALEFFQKSLKIKEDMDDQAGIAGRLNNIGVVYKSQGNYAQALECYQKSLTITEAIGDPDTAFLAYWGVGDVHKVQGHMSDAIAAYQKAIALIETLRGQVAGGEQEEQRFFEEKVDPYYAMVDLLIDQSQLAEALAYAERAKARVLLDVLQSGKVNVIKAMTTEEQEKERKLNNELVSLNTQIHRENLRKEPDATRLADLKTQLDKKRLEYEGFMAGLYAVHRDLKAQRGEMQPLTLEEASALLPDTKTALLEFVVMEEKSYLFVLTKNGEGSKETVMPKVYSLMDIKRKELEPRVKDFRKRLSKNQDISDARGLYDLLLKPAQKQLQSKTALCIVPDGVLWELPFQALQPKENHYLLEDSAIFYAPSLTALREMMKLRNQRSKGDRLPLTLLAFGNPTLGQETVRRVKSVHLDENLLPLPEAERLVKFLERLYGAARSKVYVGADAREGRLKTEAGNARILQLATHGILNDASPMYSHVLLAQEQGDTKEDGLLEAWEIMKLDLKADMVVLSACETARGRLGAGEGVIGMTWALFVARCPTTVVSQWKVDAASTTELMEEFHRILKSQASNTRSPFSKAKALQTAALNLRKRQPDYRHPFHWAGFVLVGDGR